MDPDLLTEIETGPTRPKVGALFDFDGTLIDGYSVRAFVEDTVRHFQLPPLSLGPLIAAAAVQGGGMATFVAGVVRALKGREEAPVAALGRDLFRRSIAGMARPDARALVRAHQRQGHTVVIATSATAYQVEPFAADLGIEHVLCTRLETSDGRFTGRLAGPVLWGKEKAAAVRAFADAHGVDLEESWAYADGDEDLAFLEAVGRPRPMSPHRGLAAAASQRAWPVGHWERRPRIDLVALARSGGAAAGMGAGAGLALAAGVLNHSRRDAANVAFSAGSDLALALGGIRLRVSGAEHLWSHRPAVFTSTTRVPSTCW